jgi:hypothetical protein
MAILVEHDMAHKSYHFILHFQKRTHLFQESTQKIRKLCIIGQSCSVLPAVAYGVPDVGQVHVFYRSGRVLMDCVLRQLIMEQLIEVRII